MTLASCKPKSDLVYIQFARYTVVGGLACLVDVGLLFTITHYLNINYLISAAIGFCAGIIVNYVLCTLWVFPTRTMGSRWLEFLVFLAIGLIGLGMNQATMWFLTERMGVHYLYSKINAVAIVFFWNFFARKIALFREGTRNA
jgi:putative flippase GtrA